jgi:ABC-2 type transport system permease protein
VAAALNARPWAAFAASALRECEFLRKSPPDLALATWLPALLLATLAAMFGAGAIRDLPIAVVDDDRSDVSRELVRMLDAAPGLRVTARPASLGEAWPLVRGLDVYAVLYVPRDATRRLRRGELGTLTAYYNASYLTNGQSALRDISSVAQDFNAATLARDVAAVKTPSRIRAAPVRVQASVLFNAPRSYEHFLVGWLIPAVLHFALCLAVVGALGRELRDGTAREWLAAAGGRVVAAVLGKVAPYFVSFMLLGAAGLVWLHAVRGAGIAGNSSVLLTGYALLFISYAAIALLFVGATRDMGRALAMTGLYAGTSLAFSGTTFPLIDAPAFTQIFSRLLPFSTYVKLQAQQVDVGSPLAVSLLPLATLLAFTLLAGGFGLRLYARAAAEPAESKS